MIQSLEVERLGPIRRASIEFGDLTVFVGPQASGKSLFLQLLKATLDAGAIRTDLKSHGFEWTRSTDFTKDFCSVYFGGGLENILHSDTSIRRDGKDIQFSTLAKPSGGRSKEETVFLIPAQRVLVLADGWPKPFMAFSEGDPYCLRHFSDALRRLMEQGLGRKAAIFPQPKRLKAELKKLIDESIYIGGALHRDTKGGRQRIMLSPSGEATSLPLSAWSAGQREFTPLLLGLYWLMPPGKTPRIGHVETVIIEEPEMGLHPQAIVSFGLLVLELLQRNYQVLISTHSPVVLDIVWAIRELKNSSSRATARKTLQKIFGLNRSSPALQRIFNAALSKEYRTYSFERINGGVEVRDISSLDPGASEREVSGWGGLSGFSGQIAEYVGLALESER